MKSEQLTTKHLEEINRLYASFFFPNIDYHGALLYVTDFLLEKVKENLTFHNSYITRLGSQWTPHSKLNIARNSRGDVVVKFEPNFSPEERKLAEYQEAQQAKSTFERAVLEYLAQQSEQLR